MKEADLSGQDALTEPAVASAQHRPADGIELGDDTQTRRHGVPGAYRASTVDHLAGVVAVGIEPVHVLADRAGVVEPQPGIDRDPLPTRRVSLTNAPAVTNSPPEWVGSWSVRCSSTPFL